VNLVLHVDVGPVRPANFARNRRRPWPEAATAAARGATVAGNPPAGEAERALGRIEWNFTELTHTVPMIEIEDLPPSMQTHMVGLPQTWVRLFRWLGCWNCFYRQHRLVIDGKYSCDVGLSTTVR
jgi:hypothetical protein